PWTRICFGKADEIRSVCRCSLDPLHRIGGIALGFAWRMRNRLHGGDTERHWCLPEALCGEREPLLRDHASQKAQDRQSIPRRRAGFARPYRVAPLPKSKGLANAIKIARAGEISGACFRVVRGRYR